MDESTSSDHQEAWDGYRAAVVSLQIQGEDVVVGPLEIVGEIAVGFGPPQGISVHILTADNPGGAVQSVELNAAAHQALLTALADRGLDAAPAIGHDIEETHVEHSVAVAGLTDDQAIRLGRRFGQQAIFAWRPDSWDLIRCSDGAVESRPWGGLRKCPGVSIPCR